MCGKVIVCVEKKETIAARTLCTTNHGTAVKMRKGFWKRSGHTKYPLLSEVALCVMSVLSTSAATERSWSLWGHVYTSARNALGLERAKKMITFCSMNMQRLLIRMTLGACWGELVEGTGRQGEGAGAADLIEGQGSESVIMSSTSAILYGELGSRRCESEVVLVKLHSFCRQLRKHHNRVDSQKCILTFAQE
jgi:hypothetical protein